MKRNWKALEVDVAEKVGTGQESRPQTQFQVKLKQKRKKLFEDKKQMNVKKGGDMLKVRKHKHARKDLEKDTTKFLDRRMVWAK